MTDDETVKPDYEVGYKRPPKHSQFQKGHKGYLRGKARVENKAKSSMTEAVTKKVHTRDSKGKRRSATLQEVIASSLATKAAKGDLKAAGLVYRQLERERGNGVSNSARDGSLLLGDEKPRRTYSEIMFDFANDMWEETYQMCLDENRKYITDGDCRNGALRYIFENYVESKQRYASEFDYRIFILMLAAIAGYKLKPHIKLSKRNGKIEYIRESE
jgi:hypothetical protein